MYVVVRRFAEATVDGFGTRWLRSGRILHHEAAQFDKVALGYRLVRREGDVLKQRSLVDRDVIPFTNQRLRLFLKLCKVIERKRDRCTWAGSGALNLIHLGVRAAFHFTPARWTRLQVGRACFPLLSEVATTGGCGLDRQ